MEEKQEFSLLWPDNNNHKKDKNDNEYPEQFITDLSINELVHSLCINSAYFNFTRDILINLCNSPAVINYRQAILEDFTKIPSLTEKFLKVLPIIDKLAHSREPELTLTEPTLKVLDQLDTLNQYTQCISMLYEILSSVESELKSEGMIYFYKFIKEIIEGVEYNSLAKELPELKQILQNLTSVTIGINVNPKLQPLEAIFLSVHSQPFKEKSVVSRLFGLKSNDEKVYGISQFYSILKESSNAFVSAFLRDLGPAVDNAMKHLSSSIARYTNVNVSFLAKLEPEIYYFLGAARFIKKLKECGLLTCRPKVAPVSEKAFIAKGIYDVTLALRLIDKGYDTNIGNMIVTNDIKFSSEGDVFILTGPNQGGKTTYTHAIGLAQVLFQAGLSIPGSNAYISPVDWIYTHFTDQEKYNIMEGKLGEESKRLSNIFKHATCHSLVLLNESLSSTSPSESLYLARDVVKGIKLLGCRAVFATHLHELAEEVDRINYGTSGNGKLISMVAGVEKCGSDHLTSEAISKRNYKVFPGPPLGLSFAKDIAYQNGISYEQIVKILEKRKIK